MNPERIEEGDLMAVVRFVKVIRRKDTFNENLFFAGYGSIKSIEVIDVDDKDRFLVSGESLLEKMPSADKYETTLKASRTVIVEKLMTSFNRPLTAKFVKADGTERTIRGRLIRSEPLFGRTIVEDLDLEETNREGSRNRQVDHRTIFELIVDGVKYTVK